MPIDTSEKAAAIQQDIFRRMSTSRRLQLALEMSESLREIALAGLRYRHPELHGKELWRALISTLYEPMPYGPPRW